MKIEQVKELANAVLYEGYLLYPYRHSAIKNRRRWTFGVVYPQEYSEANGSIEPCMMQTECLVSSHANTKLDIYVRFLHLLVRSAVHPDDDRVGGGEDELAPGKIRGSLTGPAVCLAGTFPNEQPDNYLARRLAGEPWEEGVEREVIAENLSLHDLISSPRHVPISFPAARMVEPSTDGSATEIVREQQAISGMVIISAKPVDANLFKLNIQISNTTPKTRSVTSRHGAILQQSFASTHTILSVHQGEFASLLEPPQTLQSLVQECQNIHTWPVLVGDKNEHNTMLSSPIILYDYPQIAPESPGALFDGTEIDEILTLRIMTLTDEEKAEMRQGDARAREILERTESLSPEQFMKLHGVIRQIGPGNLGLADLGGEA
jgi:hypothetical protein